MHNWWHAFFNAVVFLTRIPAPPGVRFTPEDLDRSAVFFPLIGLLIGSASAAVFWGAQLLWPHSVAVGLSMAFSILLTGGFHEDGLADICDGFGGGWTRDKILTIMKDSRLGTFGTLGLFLVLGLKWFCLNELLAEQVCLALITGHCLSRWAAISLIALGKPVAHRSGEKPKPMAGPMSLKRMVIATVFAAGVFFLLPPNTMLFALPVIILIPVYLYRYYQKWIGGYTGDGLGTVQQITEISLYLTFLGVWQWNVSS